MSFKITAEEKAFLLNRRKIISRKIPPLSPDVIKRSFDKLVQIVIDKDGKKGWKRERRDWDNLSFNEWKEWVVESVEEQLDWRANETLISFQLPNKASGWGGLGTTIVKPLAKALPEFFEKRGHYLARSGPGKMGFTLFNFEANYGERVDKLPKFLYHIGPSRYKDRILKRGLFAQKKSRSSNIHKGRVYLAEKDLLDGLQLGLEEWDREHGTEQFYSLFKIETSKLRKGTKLYRDTEFVGHGETRAYYTYTSIPPPALTLVKDLEPKMPSGGDYYN